MNSAEEYSNLVISTIIESEKTLPLYQQLPENLLNYWIEEIKEYAEVTWTDAIIGKRDSYIFSESELKWMFERAGLNYAQDLLNGLVDKNMIQAKINEKGEIVYELTEDGRDQINMAK